MLMQEATPEVIEEWKKAWGKYRDKLKPNRKNGQEIIDFPSIKIFSDGTS